LALAAAACETRGVAKHVIGAVAEFPRDSSRRVEIEGRGIAVFNAGGRFFALRDVCPHQGAQLSAGSVHGWVESEEPGCYAFDPGRKLVRCPWHGWEYELSTGQSWSEPATSRVRAYPTTVEPGTALRRPGPYVAETLPIAVEEDYVVVEL
jgi:3-phenylpropionate/trans-cinnamate dioxygenase ferredoxin subunit